jgi:hypothetical protein
MLVLGAGVFPSISKLLKSVCVSSLLGGPRSRVRGLGIRSAEDVINGREVSAGDLRGMGLIVCLSCRERLETHLVLRICVCGVRRKFESSLILGRYLGIIDAIFVNGRLIWRG